MKACLDTHTALWSLADDPRLGADARALIADTNRSELIVPDIVLLEISYLLAKGRITDDEGPEAALTRISNSYRVVPITAEIAHLALTLDLPHGDPFDRIITATAVHHQVPLLTRDKALTNSAAVRTLW